MCIYNFVKFKLWQVQEALKAHFSKATNFQLCRMLWHWLHKRRKTGENRKKQQTQKSANTLIV